MKIISGFFSLLQQQLSSLPSLIMVIRKVSEESSVLCWWLFNVGRERSNMGLVEILNAPSSRAEAVFIYCLSTASEAELLSCCFFFLLLAAKVHYILHQLQKKN